MTEEMERKRGVGIVAANVVASQLLERKQTGMPPAGVKIVSMGVWRHKVKPTFVCRVMLLI